MRSYGWVFIQYDWCPYKKRLGHRHTQREDRVRTPTGEGSHLQTEEGSLRRNQLCQTLILDF
ncbi:unnamed protein product [Nyctereutes procyonoides]|uniref:(raccoon dog) hypothetical protein n=1 Tax=Nyctereutes procyonoides TaxID=34880 RepID=A0A811YGU3_NYCPR|nr:unnamed protein product [Nyctereutes procyonoides]